MTCCAKLIIWSSKRFIVLKHISLHTGVYGGRMDSRQIVYFRLLESVAPAVMIPSLPVALIGLD